MALEQVYLPELEPRWFDLRITTVRAEPGRPIYEVEYLPAEGRPIPLGEVQRGEVGDWIARRDGKVVVGRRAERWEVFRQLLGEHLGILRP